MPAGLTNKAVHLAQAQAGPSSYALCCKERIERLCDNIRRHPRTSIRNRDEHVLTWPHRVLLGVSIIDERVLSFDREFSSAGHRIARIYCEIEDRILKLRQVGFNQAYKEIKEDEHPIIVICASDIVRLLKSAGISDTSDVSVWLEAF